jgi:hypothetical protein
VDNGQTEGIEEETGSRMRQYLKEKDQFLGLPQVLHVELPILIVCLRAQSMDVGGTENGGAAKSQAHYEVHAQPWSGALLQLVTWAAALMALSARALRVRLYRRLHSLVQCL